LNSVLTYVKANWKTNLAAAAAFLFSVPQFITAIQAWQNGQKADWRGAVVSLVIALGLAAAKDGDNHSSLAQVEAKQATVEGKPNAPALVAAAQKQVEAGK
jgi:drug/metabolite transporter (DMT)-like permease